MRMEVKSIWSKYGFLWLTLVFFVFSLLGHWLFAWFAYVDEQTMHGEPIEAGPYFIEVMRDTLENWQSEFLQLMWQVAGLSFLFYIGSPQSKEGDDRTEEKIDAILKTVAKDGEKTIHALNTKYPRQ
jgi:hypothetical protein